MAEFERARRQMVETQLLPQGVTDPRLLAAFAAVPRELFVPDRRVELAYADLFHALGAADQVQMLPAALLARLLQLAEIRPTDRVLDAAAGTGYAAAILSQVAGQVFATDQDADLVALARGTLDELGHGAVALRADALAQGWRDHAPFDVIVLAGTVDVPPRPLLDQLAEGGRLVTFVGRSTPTPAHLFVRTGKAISTHVGFDATVPHLAVETPAPPFVF